MSWETGSERIQELIDAGELGQVSPDNELAQRMLSDAGRHLATAAAAEATGDLSGAYQLAYDALRKSTASLLEPKGSGRPVAAGTSPCRTRLSPSLDPPFALFARSAGCGARGTVSSTPVRRVPVLRKTT
jgi:hypothetical protein